MLQKKLATAVYLLAGITLFISSCSDTSTGPDTQDSTLEAVISYSPQSPGVGEEVTLNAAGSKDDQSIGYDSEWSFVSKPSNSTATINNSTQSTATFTPDVAGDYTVKLQISNSSEGASDEAETTISVISSNQSYVELSGSIDSDLTLENIFDDPAQKDYLVTGNLSVNATLTVEPGVVVHFEEGILMSVNQNGTLIAEGTASDSIKFTSSNSAAGLLWQGVFVKSSTTLNSMKYVDVSHAGNSEMDFAGYNYKAAVGVMEGGKLSIENSYIHHNDGYGVYVDDDGGILGVFASNRVENNTAGVAAPANVISSISGDNLFAGNPEAAIEITSSTLAETNDVTWNAMSDGSAYLVSGNLNISGTLTVAPGATFEMAEDVLWTVNGALIADGTSSAEIRFTSSNVTGGLYWQGIHIKSADSRNSFSYAELTYGGNSAMDFSGYNFAALVGVDATAKVSVANTTISESKGYGLYADDEGGELVAFSNNNFANNVTAVGIPADEVDDMDTNTTFSNNLEAEVEIFSTTYDSGKASAWKPLSDGASYRVTGHLNVDGELTINAGARFELDQDVQVVVDGALMANGENGNKIIFTSSNISGNLHWRGLFIRSADSRNVLNYVDVGYAGNSALEFSGANYSANVGVNENAQLTITNSVIFESAAYGIYSKGTTNDFENAGNVFKANPDGNVTGTVQ